ncbi:hypothetical protein B0H15DRAFT_798935 [Mycena belliarum]|uniref:Uncharacterized protein n=1 Tax=Mycena belliarum TaxID=1033014 RepID=A0AAD6XRB3_9AGAR|nr:hypothetical protein B0H15DRAFT_798935 [Mycena belliae]
MPASTTSTSIATTHASRNPTLDVQRKKNRVGRPKGKLTSSQKATRALQVAQRKVKRRALEEDLDAWFDRRDDYIEELAKKHDRTPDYIKALLTNPTQFKHTRKISVRNAIVHDLALQASARGETLSLKDLNELADTVMLEPLDPEDVAKWKKQLGESRRLKRVGLRGNNLSAAADARTIVARIEDEIMNLFERTGTRCFALFTRGHVDDGFTPTYAESGGSIDFFLQSTGTHALAWLRRFEQWACVQDRSPRTLETLNAMRHQIQLLVTGGLHGITKNKTLTMSYAHCEVDVQQPWKVKLIGWPEDIPFVNPSKLGTIDRVRRIRDALRNNDIQWVHMRADEVAALEADIERRRKDGTLGKTRKQRSDQGKKHRRARGDDDDDSDEDDEDDADDDEDDEDDEDDDHEDEDITPRDELPAPSGPPLPSYAPPIVDHHEDITPRNELPAPSGPPLPSYAPPIVDLGTVDAPADFALPAGFDDFEVDFETMTVDLESLGSSFGRGDQAYQALQGLNAMAAAAPAAYLAYSAAADPAAGYPAAAYPAAAYPAAADPAAADPAAAHTATVNITGGAYPTVHVGNGAFPTVNVGGGTFPTVHIAGSAPPSTPFSTANTGGYQFNAPSTPASFAPKGKKRASKARTGGDVDTAKKPRKPRSDKGKSRAKANLLENETPEAKAARMANRKALALRKIAARAGRL